MTKHADADTLKKLWSLITDVKVSMLTSEDGPHLRARPMVAAQKDFDGTLFFFTRVHAHKVDEVTQRSRVCVTYADPEKQNYVSLSGTATVIQDEELVKAHWSEGMRTWFPKGVDDPEIAVLKVDVEQAEYWDAPSSTMVYLYGYAKAVTTGKAPKPGENEKVSLV
jgi:general stress protein 26